MNARALPALLGHHRHADICHVSTRPDLFLDAPGTIADRLGMEIDRSQGLGSMRTLIETDPPEHRALRKVASPWFTRRALRRIDAELDAGARELVDMLAGDGVGYERLPIRYRLAPRS